VRAQSGPAADGILTEDSPPAPTDGYGRSKLAAEREIAADGGPYVILRPTLVYGRGVRGNFMTLRLLASLPSPLLLGGIHNARSLLAVENFAAAIVVALTSDAALGGTFLVADPAPVSLAEILTLLRRGVGRRPWLVPVPAALYNAALILAGQRGLRDRLLGNLVVSTARLEALGYMPVASPETALPALGTSLKDAMREIRRRRS
jgi:nucleoside-diphosphate-sugar epimerase